MDQSTSNRLKLPATVAVLLVVDSLHFVFARLALPYLSPITTSFYYMTIAMVQIAIFAALRGKIDWRLFRKNARFFLLIGFLIAVATATSYAAVIYVDPGTASLVARMGTIFALGFGILWLKETLVRGQKIGSILAVIGVFVISFQPSGENNLLWLGSLLVLISTFSYQLHAAVVKKYGEDMDFLNFFLFRMASTCLFLLFFALGSGEMVWPVGWEVWLILLLTATVNVTVSRSLYYLILRRFKLSIFTIILTLSPVITILWSIALFGERPSSQSLLGGSAVILGVILVTSSRRKTERRKSYTSD